MMLDTREMISVTEANQNFSRATRIADQRGKAVSTKMHRSGMRGMHKLFYTEKFVFARKTRKMIQ